MYFLGYGQRKKGSSGREYSAVFDPVVGAYSEMSAQSIAGSMWKSIILTENFEYDFLGLYVKTDNELERLTFEP